MAITNLLFRTHTSRLGVGLITFIQEIGGVLIPCTAHGPSGAYLTIIRLICGEEMRQIVDPQSIVRVRRQSILLDTRSLTSPYCSFVLSREHPFGFTSPMRCFKQTW